MPLESHCCEICYIGIRALEPCSFWCVAIIPLCILLCWDLRKWGAEFGEWCNFIFVYSEPHTRTNRRSTTGDGRGPRAHKKIPLISAQIIDCVICTHECWGTERMWFASWRNEKSNAAVERVEMADISRPTRPVTMRWLPVLPVTRGEKLLRRNLSTGLVGRQLKFYFHS